MEKNVGILDRIARLILGIIFLALFLTKTVSGIGGIILIALAIILIFTASTGFCGLYKILGMRT